MSNPPCLVPRGTMIALPVAFPTVAAQLLSENELVELLDQLKLGALHGVASEADPVGHWPVLIGDGLCLSLQAAARDEFARQPDKITVVEGLSQETTLSSVCSSFWQVHHVSTGLHDRSILIGYDQDCLELFSLLHDAVISDADSENSTGQSTAAYDFSLAVAASLDPAVHLDGVDHPVAFLPLEFEADTRLAGGWRICVDAFDKQGEFFIGLLNPFAETRTAALPCDAVQAEILVHSKTLSRLAGATAINVTLSLPAQVNEYSPAQVQAFDLQCVDQNLIGRPAGSRCPTAHLSALDLMVQQTLQLSADDLYLLLVEAMGIGSGLRIRFVPGVHGPDFSFTAGARYQCLSVNGLPVNHAELIFTGDEFILLVKE